MLQRLSTPAIACSGSYLPNLLRVLRRLVHPDEQRDGVSNGANVGKLVKISGPGDYYSDEEEEYPRANHNTRTNQNMMIFDR